MTKTGNGSPRRQFGVGWEAVEFRPEPGHRDNGGVAAAARSTEHECEDRQAEVDVRHPDDDGPRFGVVFFETAQQVVGVGLFSAGEKPQGIVELCIDERSRVWVCLEVLVVGGGGAGRGRVGLDR